MSIWNAYLLIKKGTWKDWLSSIFDWPGETMNAVKAVDDMPPFDPQHISARMEEARERVRKLAVAYPGVWAWAETHQRDMCTGLSAARKEYDRAFASGDAGLCCKWIYYCERYSKQLIQKYKTAKRPS
jgi:hypothetical protein